MVVLLTVLFVACSYILCYQRSISIHCMYSFRLQNQIYILLSTSSLPYACWITHTHPVTGSLPINIYFGCYRLWQTSIYYMASDCYYSGTPIKWTPLAQTLIFQLSFIQQVSFTDRLSLILPQITSIDIIH